MKSAKSLEKIYLTFRRTLSPLTLSSETTIRPIFLLHVDFRQTMGGVAITFRVYKKEELTEFLRYEFCFWEDVPLISPLSKRNTESNGWWVAN